jgi:hypothetical protein
MSSRVSQREPSIATHLACDAASCVELWPNNALRAALSSRLRTVVITSATSDLKNPHLAGQSSLECQPAVRIGATVGFGIDRDRPAGGSGNRERWH